MSLFQRLLNKVFGVQYVMLLMTGGKAELRRAYELAGKVWANPYLPETRTQLLPCGKVTGPVYVKGWLPATEKTRQLWNKDEVEVEK